MGWGDERDLISEGEDAGLEEVASAEGGAREEGEADERDTPNPVPGVVILPPSLGNGDERDGVKVTASVLRRARPKLLRCAPTV